VLLVLCIGGLDMFSDSTGFSTFSRESSYLVSFIKTESILFESYNRTDSNFCSVDFYSAYEFAS
jgi:hypothetical protein